MAKKIKIKLKKTSPKLKKALNGVAVGDEKAQGIGEDSFNNEDLYYRELFASKYPNLEPSLFPYKGKGIQTNVESFGASPLQNNVPLITPNPEQNNTQFPKSKKFQPNIQGSRSSTETFMTGLRNLPDAIKDPSNPAAWAAVGDLPMTGTKAILEQIGARKTNNRLNKQSVEQFQDAQTLNFLNDYNDSQYGTTNIGMAEHGKLIKYPDGGRTPIKGTKEQDIRINTDDNSWLTKLDNILSAPQRAITYGLTGKYQNPSEALGIENKWGALAADVVLDPTNLLGVGILNKVGKTARVIDILEDGTKVIRELGKAEKPFELIKGGQKYVKNSYDVAHNAQQTNKNFKRFEGLSEVIQEGNQVRRGKGVGAIAGVNDLLMQSGAKPVQPIIYQPEQKRSTPEYWSDANGIYQDKYPMAKDYKVRPIPQRPKEQPINIESFKPDLLQGSDINMFNPIPFEKGTYFTRERQSQEQSGGTDYFDKKTGKLMGTYEDGGIAKYKSMNQGGMANVEVENLETIQTPDGLIDTAYGNTHAKGGIPMMLEEGSKVFSEKLKHPEKKKSFAKLAKKFETKKDFENLESPVADNINKFTADLNIQFKNKASDELFAEQEGMKISGVFGEKVKNNTMKDYEMKYGGLTKMDVGGVNYGALSNVEEQLGVLKNGMPSSTGYDNKSIHKLDAIMEKRIKDTIGKETWDKLPNNLKTQVFSFAFNNGVEKKNWLTGLAQAIDPSIKDRLALTEADAISKIKSNISKINNNVYNNYINTVLPDQYNSIGAANNKQNENKKLWQFRANNIDQYLNQNTNQPTVNITPNGVTPTNAVTNSGNTNMTPFESTKDSRKKPSWWGDRTKLEEMMSNFEKTSGYNFPYYTPDYDVNKMAADYQKAVINKHPQIVTNLFKNKALPFTNKAVDLYKKQNKTKTTPNETELVKFYNKNPQLITEQFGDDLWGMRGFEMQDLPFNSQEEYSAWKQDKDWIPVGDNYFYDVSGENETPLVYKPKLNYSAQQKVKRPSEKLEIPASTPIEKGKYNNQGFKAIPVVQPFQEPYLESPVARFTFNPNLIDYRNQNPDFTEIDRQYQGATTGDPRIDANLFAKTLNAKNQIAFGTQAQNRQGQMQTDQYNAGSLDRLQQLQYGEDNTYRGLVNQMRGALNTQKLMDRSVAQSNAQKQMDYYNFTLPTIETLYGVDPNEQYIKKGNPLSPYTTTPTKKYGGKIKPKFKKKSSK